MANYCIYDIIIYIPTREMTPLLTTHLTQSIQNYYGDIKASYSSDNYFVDGYYHYVICLRKWYETKEADQLRNSLAIGEFGPIYYKSQDNLYHVAWAKPYDTNILVIKTPEELHIQYLQEQITSLLSENSQIKNENLLLATKLSDTQNLLETIYRIPLIPNMYTNIHL